ncbi:MAG: hypothetical protein PVI43_00270 [Candidatus Bathyarchaeota archaeon]|jgi:hypothetical protein
MKDGLLWLAVVVMMGFFGTMIYKTWTLGSDPDDYDTVCLDGHEYWYANFAMKAVLSVKLTDKGKPVNCK